MNTNNKDGLEDFTLGKPYGDNPAGAVLRVDAIRRDWLVANGFASEPEMVDKPKKKARV